MERYHQIKELFQAAIELEANARAEFLSEACADDVSLKAEVEHMLAASEEAESFIEAPAYQFTEHFTTQRAIPQEPTSGSFIGHYKVIREIGEGGMGAVYLAVRADDQYKKRVAIKLIKGGANNQYLRRRFLSERQILASLDHPNIAKLLDGGTTEDGSPYLVMDYIEGLPINEYCDNNKLSTLERLKLFRQICAAVYYAHQNLVIHRDIKPGNILVTADGTPRLLDFGIAKLLNPELSGQTLDMTAGPMGPMTPEYASPEQVRGETLTTSSDIYSLGIVLYELLTGHRPYKFPSRVPHAIAQIICEQEPQKPSTVINRIETNPYGFSNAADVISPESVSRTREGQVEKLRRRLQGDLDNIVLMAMRKEATHRYASVEQFSEDIRRHLEGLPCIARKATFSYKAIKFIKRNKIAVAASLLVALSLLGGIVATLWQARVAHLQRVKAEQRFNDVRELANSFMFEIHDGIETLPGSTPVRQLLVNKALKYLDNLAQESSDNISLRRELATAYVKVGDIQGNPTVANLGDMEGALSSYRKALQIRESLSVETTKDLDRGLDLATSYDRVGDMLLLNHNIEETTEYYQKACKLREQLAEKEPNQAQVRFDLSLSYSNLADALTQAGNPSESLENYRKSLSIRQALLAPDPTNIKYRRSIAALYYRMAALIFDSGDKAGGVEIGRKSLALFEGLLQENPQNSKARRELALAHNNLGDLLWYNDDLKGATEEYRIGLVMREELLKADPTNMQARRDLAVSYSNYGYTLVQAGNPQGLEYYHINIEVMESLLAANPGNANSMRDVAITYSVCSDAYGMMGDRETLPEAKRIEYYQKAISLNQRSLSVWGDLRERDLLRYKDVVTPSKIEKATLNYEKQIELLKK
jgi:eukaryotic-like serine/threonine-protein kinase